MVGRTPEYLRKKITAREIKLVSLYILTMPLIVLIGTGIAMSLRDAAGRRCSTPGRTGCPRCSTPSRRPPTTTAPPSPGSRANTPFYNTALGLAMLLGRFLPIIFVLALAGSLARQQPVPADRGHAAHPRPAVRRDARRRRRHRRRPDLLPRPRSRSARGRPLMTTLTHVGSHPGAHTASQAGCSTPGCCSPRCRTPLRKLDPRVMVRNPVMFVVEVGAVLSTVLAVADPSVFAWSVVVWLWLTVVFANLAEAVAEGRGKAQAATLRRGQDRDDRPPAARRRRPSEDVPATAAARSATGSSSRPARSSPATATSSRASPASTSRRSPASPPRSSASPAATAARSPAAPRCSPTGSSSQITAKPGESFIDRMIALVEGASRQKTPNEIALNILLASLTIVFLAATVTLQPFAVYSGAEQSVDRAGRAAGLPDPDHDRRAAVGDRHRRHGPAGAAQRAGHVRPRRRGRRRREHPAAGQDRHDHPRQPAGRRVPPGRRASTPPSSPTPPSCPASPTRPRRAARSSCSPRREHGLRERTPGELADAHVRAVHRADPDVAASTSPAAARSARAPRPR